MQRQQGALRNLAEAALPVGEHDGPRVAGVIASVDPRASELQAPARNEQGVGETLQLYRVPLPHLLARANDTRCLKHLPSPFDWRVVLRQLEPLGTTPILARHDDPTPTQVDQSTLVILYSRAS